MTLSSGADQTLIRWASWACAVQLARQAAQVVQRTSPPKDPLPVEDLSGARLTALVYRGLRDASDPRADILRPAYLRSLAHSMWLTEQAHEVVATLRTGQIPVLCLKGAAMQQLLYRDDPAVRPMADLDLLVPPASMGQAMRALAGAGFSSPAGAVRPVSARWSGEVGLVRNGVAGGVVIDLHRALHNWPLQRRLTAALVRHAVGLAASPVGPGLPVPTLSLCVLVIAAHRAKHHFRGDLRELVDLRLLVAKMSGGQRGELLQQARRLGLTGALAVVLEQAACWLGPPNAAEADIARGAREGLRPLQRALLGRFVASRVAGRPRQQSSRLRGFLEQYSAAPMATGEVLPAVVSVCLYVGARLLDTCVAGAASPSYLASEVRRVIT